MQLVESVVYLGILCIHYPLRIAKTVLNIEQKVVEKSREKQTQISKVVSSSVSKTHQTLIETKQRIVNIPNEILSYTYSIFNYFLISERNDGQNGQQKPKSFPERTFLKFQLAAFEQERAEYQKEIKRLRDELKKTQQKLINIEKEKKIDKEQIMEFEEQLKAINLRRVVEEREVTLLQLQMSFFDKEKQQYQQELQILYAKINDLEQKISSNTNLVNNHDNKSNDSLIQSSENVDIKDLTENFYINERNANGNRTEKELKHLTSDEMNSNI